jgi:ceramide glucosyltransferase
MENLIRTLNGTEMILFSLGVALLGYVLFWHDRLTAAVRRRRDARHALAVYPSISVIRPVRGADVGAEENFTAALDTGYPGEVETLFVFDSADDAGLPIAERVVAAHRQAGRPGTARTVVAGVPLRGWTGKLNAMRVGMEHARGELVAFGDSDTRPSKQVLSALVETLVNTPDAGATFAPVLVHQPAQAAGDAFYALMQNALYSPLAAHRAGAARQLPFIMGQLMVFRRQALASIGGVGAAKGQLVDDMYLGKRLAEEGWKNVMVDEPLHIATGGMTLGEFIPVFRRWMMFSRNGLPFSFTWRQWLQGTSYFASLGLLAASIATSHLLAAGAALAAFAAVGWNLLSLQRSYGGAPIPLRFAWTPWVLFLLAPAILVGNLLRKKVVWRGREYQLDAHASLAESPALAAREAHALAA